MREFRFQKTLAATPPSPAAEGTADERSFKQVYERLGNPQDSREHWQHVGGCRAWLELRRNPSTGEVRELALLGGGVP